MSCKGVVLLSVGVGLLMGGSFVYYWTYRQMRLHIQQLSCQIGLIHEQILSVKSLISSQHQQLDQNVNNNIQDNSLEEDEIFEDTYDGPLPWLSSFNPSVLRSTKDEKTEYSAFYEQVDGLFDGSEDDKMHAHELLNEQSSDLMNDVEFVWRMSKSTFFLSQIYGSTDKGKQKELIYKALDLARLALQLDDYSSNAHKWFAITLGSSCDYENITTKIQNGYKFKEHIERAISLNSNDPSFHYLLGRWCYEVYMLSWIERKIAMTLFSTPPCATIDECLEHFLKAGLTQLHKCNFKQADELNPGIWKENMLFIAKCYIEKRDNSKALKWLTKAKDLPVKNNEDVKNQAEIVTLLNKHESIYCKF